MAIKSVLASLLAAALVFCAFVFDASSRADLAQQTARAAMATEGSARALLLDRAETYASDGWSRPAAWHPGALETLSWIYAVKAEAAGGDRVLLSKSADAAMRSVRLSPLQPLAWMRLAGLHLAGVPNPLCDPLACLQRSWDAASVTNGETDCARLRIAHAAGMPLDAANPHVRDYAASNWNVRDAAACLSFLSPEDRFAVLMQMR